MNDARVGGVIFLAISLAYGYLASEIPLDFWSEQESFNARSMPQLIAAAGICCALLMLVLPSAPTQWRELSRLSWRQPAILLGLMWLYALVFEVLGFALATFVFLNAAFAVLGERNILRMTAVSLPLVFGFWLLMDSLDIYLAPGDLIEALLGTADSHD